MEKFYTIELQTEDTKKHTHFVKANDEIEAIDKVMELYKNKNVIDVKVV